MRGRQRRWRFRRRLFRTFKREQHGIQSFRIDLMMQLAYIFRYLFDSHFAMRNMASSCAKCESITEMRSNLLKPHAIQVNRGTLTISRQECLSNSPIIIKSETQDTWARVVRHAFVNYRNIILSVLPTERFLSCIDDKRRSKTGK
jgi:hypothetical protein